MWDINGHQSRINESSLIRADLVYRRSLSLTDRHKVWHLLQLLHIQLRARLNPILMSLVNQFCQYCWIRLHMEGGCLKSVARCQHSRGGGSHRHGFHPFYTLHRLR